VRLFRRTSVPAAVRAVTLDPLERRLAWGVTTSGQAVVATDRALHLPEQDPLPWWEVERASWQRPQLVVLRVAPVQGTGQRWTVELAEEHQLAEVIRAQVTTSVAWSTHLRLAPAGGVRIVGRRRPGQDALDWQLVFDAGTDAGDPALRAQAEAAMLDAQRTIG
jgi:hypothetical protein